MKRTSSFCTALITVKARITPFKSIFILEKITYFGGSEPLYQPFCTDSCIVSTGTPRRDALRDLSNVQENSFANRQVKAGLGSIERFEPLRARSSLFCSVGWKSAHFLRSHIRTQCTSNNPPGLLGGLIPSRFLRHLCADGI